MYNKKALSKATAQLDKAKAPKKPKDIITDPMGQWKYPGLPTRIPNTDSKDLPITMDGVYRPLLAIANTGEKKMLNPNDNHTFRGAKYVDEYPMQKGGGYVDQYLTEDEIDQYRKGGYIVEDISVPELNQAQKGGESKVILSKEHTDKKGNKTIVVTKDDGTKYTKVITKDGKVYNKTTPGLNPEMREYFRKKAEWEDRSSGAAQPVDDFWTLPIGMTSAGVKGAVGLAKGLGSLGRNAAKSSLAQATKQGFNQSLIKSLPGSNLKNLLNSAFITSGINNYIDQNSDVRRATKKAYDDPTLDNVVDAVGENVWNALNFSGLNVGKGVKQLGKYATTQTPLKNTYKVLPEGTFKNYSKLKTKGKSYRVAGHDAHKDFVESGLLRSKTNLPENATLLDRIQARSTSFPSFQKDYADLRYLPENGGVVFETSLPTFKRGQLNPITGERIKGRHYAHRAIDFKTGKVLTEIPASDIDVYEGSSNWLKGHKKISGKPDNVNDNIIRSGIGGIDMSRYEIKNPDFYTQMLTTYSNKVLSPTNKKFYSNLIETIKKQNGLVTEREYNLLQRLKTGNFDFANKGYNKGYKAGGVVAKLSDAEIQDYIAQGYIVEEH